MKYLFTAFILMAVCTVYSQECGSVLSGEVIDFHDNTPLQEATIIVIEKNSIVVTDINGKFVVNHLCNGKVTLQVSHPECDTRLIEIDIDGHTYKRINLEHHLE